MDAHESAKQCLHAPQSCSLWATSERCLCKVISNATVHKIFLKMGKKTLENFNIEDECSLCCALG